MTRIAYIDGHYQPIDWAAIAPEDRGYQFADAVYEVCAVVRGALIDTQAHLDRLDYSLNALGITAPMSHRALELIMGEVVRRNRLEFGIVYLQISRGVAPHALGREHFMPKNIKPVVVITTKMLDPQRRVAIHKNGIKAVSVADLRWGRCDIKSVSLLGNVLARGFAASEGAQEAWQVDDKGYVSEGTSSNAWILDKQGVLRTAPLGANILNGTVRRRFLALAKKHKIKVQERAFTIKEALVARECFSTSSTMAVVPIVNLDGTDIGEGGKVGKFARLLAKSYDSLWD